MIYVGIDPGVRACGVAACDSLGALIGAQWARTTTKAALDPDVVRATIMATWRLCAVALTIGDSVCVGVEMPQTYGGKARGEADTNDLLELSFVIGRLIEALNARPRVHALRVDVGTWKHVPTDKLEARLSLPPPLGLNASERAGVEWPAASYRHNVVDAIYLSKWLADLGGRRDLRLVDRV